MRLVVDSNCELHLTATSCRISELRLEDPSKDVAQALEKMEHLRRLVMTNYTWVTQVKSIVTQTSDVFSQFSL